MDTPQQPTGLDGMGFLRQCAPAPFSFAILQAKVAGPNGVDTLFVLTLDSPMGANVTYWSRESLQALRDQIDTVTTGLHVAHDVPAPSRIVH